MTTFFVDCIAGWSLGDLPDPFSAQNWPKNLILLCFTNITHLFSLSRTWLNTIITIVLYLTVLYFWLWRAGCILQDTYLLYNRYTSTYKNLMSYAGRHWFIRTKYLLTRGDELIIWNNVRWNDVMSGGDRQTRGVSRVFVCLWWTLHCFSVH